MLGLEVQNHSLVTWEFEAGGSVTVQGQPGQFKETMSQNKNLKRGLRHSSVVECWPSTHESMGSTSIIANKSERKEKEGGRWGR